MVINSKIDWKIANNTFFSPFFAHLAAEITFLKISDFSLSYSPKIYNDLPERHYFPHRKNASGVKKGTLKISIPKKGKNSDFKISNPQYQSTIPDRKNGPTCFKSIRFQLGWFCVQRIPNLSAGSHNHQPCPKLTHRIPHTGSHTYAGSDGAKPMCYIVVH